MKNNNNSRLASTAVHGFVWGTCYAAGAITLSMVITFAGAVIRTGKEIIAERKTPKDASKAEVPINDNEEVV